MSTVPVWQASDQELLAELRVLGARVHSVWAEMLSVVAEVDSRGTAGTLGYGTTVELVRAVARIPRGEARARVSAAADVLPGRGLGGAPVQPRLPATAAAVAEHVIGAADVAVIRSVLARIPPHIGQDQRAEVEAELARQAHTLDAGQLAVLGKRILAYLDEDGRAPKDTPETRRHLSFQGSRGEPLDVGLASRTVPTAIRRAVIIRDGGCAFRDVQYQPAGAKFTTSSIGPTGARPASRTALRCAAAITNLSTILTGGSTWPAAFRNSTHHRGWADRHAAIPSTPPPL